MAIITLTTDLGLKDHYVSTIKGAILAQCPDATIIDVSHEIGKFNMVEAAFVLGNAYREFPPDTIHIIGVNPSATPEMPHVGIYTDQQYFIGADNGIFSMIFDKVPDKIVELTIKQDADGMTFPTKDVFVKAACHLARGGTLEVIGGPRDSIQQTAVYRPVVDGNTIRGLVLYVDSYGNLITNITRNLFKKVGKGKNFTIYFREERYRITQISNDYSDEEEGGLLALFGAYGFLQISIAKGEASNLLGLAFGAIVRIEFE